MRVSPLLAPREGAGPERARTGRSSCSFIRSPAFSECLRPNLPPRAVPSVGFRQGPRNAIPTPPAAEPFPPGSRLLPPQPSPPPPTPRPGASCSRGGTQGGAGGRLGPDPACGSPVPRALPLLLVLRPPPRASCCPRPVRPARRRPPRPGLASPWSEPSSASTDRPSQAIFLGENPQGLPALQPQADTPVGGPGQPQASNHGSWGRVGPARAVQRAPLPPRVCHECPRARGSRGPFHPEGPPRHSGPSSPLQKTLPCLAPTQSDLPFRICRGAFAALSLRLNHLLFHCHLLMVVVFPPWLL